MNITLTGSLGNISLPLAQQLISKGHTVTVVSHSPERASAITAIQAIPAIGSVDDPGFLREAFKGADAVYTMIPPGFQAADIRQYMRSVGDGYANAIADNGVKYVVNLSSVGAHLPDGPGPAGANHYVEARLNELTDTHVLHLRPGMFYTNFFGSIPMIKQQHIIGNNFDAGVNMVLTHPRDIADVAAEALDTLSFTGKHIRYIGHEITGGEVAAVLGKAIGQPDLAWIGFSDNDLLYGMMQNGLTEQMAQVYVIEIGVALREGNLLDSYREHKSSAAGSIHSFHHFAEEFAAVYLQGVE
ncbi:NAD(P)H-binding protein [Chitinophaga ginsengisegetis]|uniref:NAD(P)H-binding protein n=1 Tax=Chitinophaga ginsengisegetis TaxID=393003 RepID=UPI003415D0C4